MNLFVTDTLVLVTCNERRLLQVTTASPQNTPVVFACIMSLSLFYHLNTYIDGIGDFRAMVF